MAYPFHVTIEGTKQGKLKGESVLEGHEDKLVGIGFSYEVQSPRDTASGLPTGKRRHGPVTFTKAWGPASPQLFQALVGNELLTSALFEFRRTDAAGQEIVYQTIKLTNATVASIRQYSPPDPGTALSELEDVALVFESIEIESTLGKTVASDSWSGPA